MAVYDAAINAVTDDVLKRAESAHAREVRLDGRVAGMAASQRGTARHAGHRCSRRR